MSENCIDVVFRDVPVPLVMMFCRLIDRKDDLVLWKNLEESFSAAAMILESIRLNPNRMCDDTDTEKWMNDLADLARERVEELTPWGVIEEQDDSMIKDLFEGLDFEEATP